MNDPYSNPHFDSDLESTFRFDYGFASNTGFGGFIDPITRVPVEQSLSDASTCPLGGYSNGEVEAGWFSGGGLSELIPVYSVTAANNKVVYLEVAWESEKIDEVLQSGGTATNPTMKSHASAIPVDDVPTLNDLNGTARIPIGGWDSEGVWYNSGCGTIALYYCPAQGFVHSRI